MRRLLGLAVARVAAEWCGAGDQLGDGWCATTDAALRRPFERPMPRGSPNWTAAERDAVRAWLDGPDDRVGDLDLPRVFVYPFPPAFADMRAVLSAVPGVKKLPPNASYFDFAGGLMGENRRNETWSARDSHGSARNIHGSEWRPSAAGVGRYKAATAGAPCDESIPGSCVHAGFSQHGLGLTIHRSLFENYPNRVDDPKQADLFFIPDHFIDTTLQRQKLTREQWCRAVGPIWRDHLRTFHDGATSYLRRNGRRDHFFVVGRAWHLAGDRKKKDQLRQLEQYGALEDCAYRWSGFRGAQRLVLESQYDFNRLCASVHPLPYQSFLPYASATSWGDAWFGAGDRRWLASGFFAVWDKDELTDPSGAREAFHDACDAWDACRLSLPAAGYYEAAYRNSTFALQPCGHSAVRKGIVDSLLAGAIPVLSSSEPRTHSYVSAKDQRDVWPWNWPSQGATSIILDVRELPRLAEILSRVDSEQVALMRRAISRVAAGLAWPLFPDAAVGDPDRRPNALDLAMHHLHVAVRASATDDAKGRCREYAEAALEGEGDGFALYEKQQALVDAFAESLAATKSAVRWIDWWRRT